MKHTVEMEFRIRVDVLAPDGASESDLFELAYDRVAHMDPEEMVDELELAYWEVM